MVSARYRTCCKALWPEVKAGAGVGTAVAIGLGVGAGAGVRVAVAVAVGLAVAIAVAVAVAVEVAVGSGVGDALPPSGTTQPPITSTATRRTASKGAPKICLFKV